MFRKPASQIFRTFSRICCDTDDAEALTAGAAPRLLSRGRAAPRLSRRAPHGERRRQQQAAQGLRAVRPLPQDGPLEVHGGEGERWAAACKATHIISPFLPDTYSGACFPARIFRVQGLARFIICPLCCLMHVLSKEVHALCYDVMLSTLFRVLLPTQVPWSPDFGLPTSKQLAAVSS